MEALFTIVGKDSCSWCSDCCIQKLKYIWHKVIQNLEHFTFSKRCCWSLRSFGMGRRVTGWMVPDVSRLPPCLETSGTLWRRATSNTNWDLIWYVFVQGMRCQYVEVVAVCPMTSILVIVLHRIIFKSLPISVFDNWLSRNVLPFSGLYCLDTRCVLTAVILSRLPKQWPCLDVVFLIPLVRSQTKNKELTYYKMRAGPKILLPNSLSSCWIVRLLHLVSAVHRSSLQEVHLWELGSGEPYWLPDRLPIKCAASYLFLVPLPST